MKRSINLSFIVAIIFAITTIGAAGAFVWAYLEKNHYENDTAAIVAEAVNEAKDEQRSEDKANFEIEYQKPYTKFLAPRDFGAVEFEYPKTWAAYNNRYDKSSYSVYFYPTLVPTINNKTSYALRLDISTRGYDETLKTFESQVTNGALNATPIKTAKDKYEGMRFDGEVSNDIVNGSVVVFKVRDKTLTLQTDSPDFATQFDEVILPSLTFLP